MPQFLLHHALAFNPQRRHGYSIEPYLIWDVRYPPTYASHDRYRLSSSMLNQPATNPPVPVFRIVCGLLPHRSWSVEVVPRHGRVVTVGDVLDALYSGLRHRVSGSEWAEASRSHQARVAEAFYSRARTTSYMYSRGKGEKERAYYEEKEKSAGVRRVDWLVRSTVFVGLTPSVERAYTWTLTLKRAEK